MYRGCGLRGIAISAACLVLGSPEDPQAQVRQVVLPNGRTFEVETAGGLPVRFISDDIEIVDVEMAVWKPTVAGVFQPCDPREEPSFTWVAQARVKASGKFRVTITTPLDESASTDFEVKGPGALRRPFFPQSEFPTIWAGAQSADTAWFPFQFVFVDNKSGKRFEFTQWAELDQRTLADTRQTLERVRKEFCKR